MSLKFNKATGRWEDGTGNLEARFRRKNAIQWAVALGFVLLIVFFPTEVARVLVQIGVIGIIAAGILWLFGWNGFGR